jgi:hypothetical protein
MPNDIAMRNIHLFAAAVMPKLQREEGKKVPITMTGTSTHLRAI